MVAVRTVPPGRLNHQGDFISSNLQHSNLRALLVACEGGHRRASGLWGDSLVGAWRALMAWEVRPCSDFLWRRSHPCRRRELIVDSYFNSRSRICDPHNLLCPKWQISKVNSKGADSSDQQALYRRFHASNRLASAKSPWLVFGA